MLNRYAFAAILIATTCFGQEKPPEEPAKFYKLEFVVKQVSDGKVTNSRTYTTSAKSGPRGGGSIRTGDKVPVETGPSAQFTYVDVGVNIDIGSIAQAGSEIALHVTADISSTDNGSGSHPIIRQTRWSSDVIVPLRKPTILFTSDAVASKSQMQLELTATPLQ